MNKSIFGFNKVNPNVPPANTTNLAGGPAYLGSNEQILAQYVLTGTFNNTFYASGEAQLINVLEYASKCSPEFIAKLAVYARQDGFMKDTPALLLGVLSTKNPKLFKTVFPKVADNLKMVRNFVKIMRSGVVGRNSLGTLPKKMVQEFLTSTPIMTLFTQSAGNDPSLSDLVRMVHPKPKTNEQNAFFAYLLGKEYDRSFLDAEILKFEDFKKSGTGTPPEVNFQFLSNIKMNPDQWTSVAKNMSWHTLRMNLNTLTRNGVFNNPEMVKSVGETLANKDIIERVKVLPFQIFNSIRNTDPSFRHFLDQALSHSLRNVPTLNGRKVVFVDVSGSMSAPVLGERAHYSSSSPVTCSEAAALFAAALKASDPENTVVIPFHDNVVPDSKIEEINKSSKLSVYEMANLIARSGSGGTNCSSGLTYIATHKMKFDSVIMLSDNQSWISETHHGTGTANAWNTYLKFYPTAKMACVDMAPYSHQVIKDSPNTINIGGFSDTIFESLKNFFNNEQATWVDRINAIEL